ncbi:TrmH family RNA methyltransferase [Streptomyces sp. BI20]|uniref:TrmH family RNA methyltransferase n=1 Tax=Streptomyces sp. BI20 TaxID=3403460 RepID=UPI003C73D807
MNETVADHWRRTAADPDHVLLDGFHAVKHALRFGAELGPVLAEDPAAVLALADRLAPDTRPALEALLRPGDLAALLPRVHPTGIAALARRPAPAPADAPRRAPAIVLDHPRNLGNVGAVVRLAAGFGADAVVARGPLDPWHPNVVRAAAGLHWATEVRRLPAETPLDAAGDGAPALPAGPLYALDPEGADIRSLTLPDDAVLAFGSERSGLTPELRARADHLVALPMRPLVSSYNLATSVAMTLFHWGGPAAGAAGPHPS